MSQTYVLYNPEAGNAGPALREELQALDVVYENCIFLELDAVTCYKSFLQGIGPEDKLILCGGDGTLHRFVNETKGLSLPKAVYYYATGSGNDFARDLGHKEWDAPEYPIGPYLEHLPSVKVKDQNRLFLNCVGFGIDGYCCLKGDEKRKRKDRQKRRKPVNYTAIAIGGLLGGYRPVKAAVTVDGEVHIYKNVWLAPVMNGRFYGGGMMAAPQQKRLAEEGTLSVLVLHCRSRLKALCIFPSIFKGTHLRHAKNAELLTGHEITVEFSSHRPLQIDGETIPDVKRYTVTSGRRR